MKKKIGVIVLVILAFILLVVFSLGNFKTGKVVSSVEIEQKNNQASDILIGEISNIQTINSSECFESRIFDFEINSIEKSQNNLKKGDKINIAFIYQVEPFPYDCISEVQERNFANIFEKDYLKLYLTKLEDTYSLVLEGDSVGCMGCETNLGKCPKVGSRFNLKETLEIYKILESIESRSKKATEAGGSYCSEDKEMEYYKQINQNCLGDYQCKTNNCVNALCSSDAGKEQETEKEQTEITEEVQEKTEELPTLSPFAKIVDWFKNIF